MIDLMEIASTRVYAAQESYKGWQMSNDSPAAIKGLQVSICELFAADRDMRVLRELITLLEDEQND